MISKRMPVLDPKEYCYEEDDGLLVLWRCYKTFPECLVLPCSCKVCVTTRCLCRTKGMRCFEYCNGQGQDEDHMPAKTWYLKFFYSYK